MTEPNQTSEEHDVEQNPTDDWTLLELALEALRSQPPAQPAPRGARWSGWRLPN